VTKQEREALADTTFAVMQVGVAHAARLDADEHLVRTGIRNVHGDDLDRRTPGARDNASNLMGHGSASR
jgi:hypothetical protein